MYNLRIRSPARSAAAQRQSPPFGVSQREARVRVIDIDIFREQRIGLATASRPTAPGCSRFRTLRSIRPSAARKRAPSRLDLTLPMAKARIESMIPEPPRFEASASPRSSGPCRRTKTFERYGALASRDGAKWCRARSSARSRAPDKREDAATR